MGTQLTQASSKDRIYEARERKRMSVASLLRKAGTISPLTNSILLRGRVMVVKRGKIWLATASGYWMVRMVNIETHDIGDEVEILAKIYPSFHGVLVYGYELAPGQYNDLMELFTPFIAKANTMVGTKVAQFLKKVKKQKEENNYDKNQASNIDTGNRFITRVFGTGNTDDVECGNAGSDQCKRSILPDSDF